MLDVNHGIVLLQLPSGEVVEYHKSVLKEADRTFVDDWVSAEENLPVGDETQVSAKLYWDTIRYVGDSLPPRVVLVALGKARGKEAATATRYSDLKIDEVVTDNGAPLTLSTDSMDELAKPRTPNGGRQACFIRDRNNGSNSFCKPSGRDKTC
ncbi:MAG TPA: hypothetical protein VFW87_13240 [Pirellulales bacterium]|nr:hypothetical protein [Pirellulales bacterium]